MNRESTMPRAAAVAGAAALVLAACNGDPGDGDAEAQPGFDDCEENPNACNEGEPADGGSIS